jgi:hypothetical protein
MGQEIDKTAFEAAEFERFAARLAEETALLRTGVREGGFSSAGPTLGCELEAWLVDEAMNPAPRNEEFLAALDDPLASPELARFNVEFNTPPLPLRGDALARLESQLQASVRRADAVARGLGLRLLLIGILPTLRDEHLIPANMSASKRYHALNEQVLRSAERPIALDIAGREHVRSAHSDVMLEAGTTSFQIHLQYPLERIHRIYNAAIMASAPLTAAGQNSPFLFGRELWRETRIALFEQAIPIGGLEGARGGPLHRVGFGSDYARHCLSECFEENLAHFPILLPLCADAPPEFFFHLRLHNGTIWRWNRPVVGFEADGAPHLRVEQRTLPAGPSIVDSVANTAFLAGLVEILSAEPKPPVLPFAQARDNFYRAARHGLEAHVLWSGDAGVRLRKLILGRLLAMAREGLENLHLDAGDIDRHLGIVEARTASGLTGAEWQTRYIARHPDDFAAMTAAYLANQQGGNPVHEWSL